jgi:hypothetical protein
MKSLRKLAVIRDDEESPCPFGLSIVADCASAGDSVDEMEIITDPEEQESAISRNRKLFERNVEPKKCKYAAHLFKNKKHVVDCDFGDTAAGLSQEVSFVGSPYYSQPDGGSGMGRYINPPLMSLPDGMEGGNQYYGNYSWGSARNIRSILRQSLLEAMKSRQS